MLEKKLQSAPPFPMASMPRANENIGAQGDPNKTVSSVPLLPLASVPRTQESMGVQPTQKEQKTSVPLLSMAFVPRSNENMDAQNSGQLPPSLKRGANNDVKVYLLTPRIGSKSSLTCSVNEQPFRGFSLQQAYASLAQVRQLCSQPDAQKKALDPLMVGEVLMDACAGPAKEFGFGTGENALRNMFAAVESFIADSAFREQLSDIEQSLHLPLGSIVVIADIMDSCSFPTSGQLQNSDIGSTGVCCSHSRNEQLTNNQVPPQCCDKQEEKCPSVPALPTAFVRSFSENVDAQELSPKLVHDMENDVAVCIFSPRTDSKSSFTSDDMDHQFAALSVLNNQVLQTKPFHLSKACIPSKLPQMHLVQPTNNDVLDKASLFITLTPRDVPQSLMYSIEEEFEGFTALQACHERGPGKAEAEEAWKLCVMRENLKKLRYTSSIRQTICDHMISLVGSLLSYEGEPMFDFCVLEKLEAIREEEDRILLQSCLHSWIEIHRKSVAYSHTWAASRFETEASRAREL